MKKWQTALRALYRRLWWREIGAAALFLSALMFSEWIATPESSVIGHGTFTGEVRPTTRG